MDYYQELIPVTVEITRGAYEWFSRIASNMNMDLGEWMMDRVVHDLNRSSHMGLTGYEYDELEKELNRRIELGADDAHPTLVYHDFIDEWDRRRLKEALEREKENYELGEPRFGFADAYDLVSKYLHYFELEEDNWKKKMDEPLNARVIKEPKEDE